MKVKTLIEFYGLKEARTHLVGDVFDVSPERFEEIKNFVEKVKDGKSNGVKRT